MERTSSNQFSFCSFVEPKQLEGFYRELSFSCCSDSPLPFLFLPSFGLEESEQLNVICSHSDG